MTKAAKESKAPAQKHESTIVRVVCCSNLMTGVTAELNLLSGGNGPFLVGENGNGKCLREGAIYDVKIRFLPLDEDDDDDDDFAPHGIVLWAKEVSKARYTKLLNHPDLNSGLDEEED